MAKRMTTKRHLLLKLVQYVNRKLSLSFASNHGSLRNVLEHLECRPTRLEVEKE